MSTLRRNIALYVLVGDELIEYTNNQATDAMSMTCMKNPTRENIPRYHSNIIATSAKKPRMIWDIFIVTIYTEDYFPDRDFLRFLYDLTP